MVEKLVRQLVAETPEQGESLIWKLICRTGIALKHKELSVYLMERRYLAANGEGF